ncbi:MAG TPA: DUF72 domain-containing protein [Acidimicrobiia bacterium]|nr:DUF72 domain-containing protein [Acidimicrobiia bacterium]
MAVYVGTSGWQYRDWRGAFYPARLAQSRWLEQYAAAFAVIEVNNTFYRLPERSTFEEWAVRTPADFVFAMKASRYLTHIRRLRDPAEPVARMLDHAGGLGRKLGPVLIQLPPNLRAEPQRLAETLGRFPRRVRVAVEARHESWFADDVYRVLREHDAALCLTDRARRRGPVERTADWYFLRFHEGVARPHPCYGDKTLVSWIDRLGERWPASADGYVFFNNDQRACAVRDAARFAELATRAGLEPTRAPSPRDVHVRGR